MKTPLRFALCAWLVLSPLELGAQEIKKLTDASIPTASSVADADLFYLVQSGVSKKVTWTTIKSSDLPLYAKLTGRNASPGQTLFGGTLTGQELKLCANAADTTECITVDLGSIQLSVAPNTLSLNTTTGLIATLMGSSQHFAVRGDGGGFPSAPRFVVTGLNGDARSLNSFAICTDVEDEGTCTCFAQTGDALFHDADCDSTVDIGDDNLSTDDDQPDSDSEVPNDITVQSSASIETAGHIQLGSLTAGSSARLVRNSGDEIYHDTDADSTEDAGENNLNDAGGTFRIVPEEMQIVSGATRSSAGFFPTLVFADSATDRVAGTFVVPPALRGRTFDVRVAYVTSVSSCNVRLRSNYAVFDEGDSISSTTQTDTTVAGSTNATTMKYQTLLSAVNLAAGKPVGVFDFRRLGSDGADTCAGTFSLIALQLNVI